VANLAFNSVEWVVAASAFSTRSRDRAREHPHSRAARPADISNEQGPGNWSRVEFHRERLRRHLRSRGGSTSPGRDDSHRRGASSGGDVPWETSIGRADGDSRANRRHGGPPAWSPTIHRTSSSPTGRPVRPRGWSKTHGRNAESRPPNWVAMTGLATGTILMVNPLPPGRLKAGTWTAWRPGRPCCRAVLDVAGCCTAPAVAAEEVTGCQGRPPLPGSHDNPDWPVVRH